MSGLDPLAAALAAQAVAGAQAAMDEAVLSLGSDADMQVLQAQISVGDVVAATVLPPQGGTDLLSFLGQTVPAQIPPGVNPGESLLLQVTGFTNTAVLVRNLGTVDPQNPIPTVEVALPPSAPGAPQAAVLTTILPPAAAPEAPAPPPMPAAPAAPASFIPPPASNVAPPPAPASTAPPPPSPPAPQPANVAPPRAVFIAAAVRAAPPAAPRSDAPVRAAASAPEPLSASEVETRIALTRASSGALPQRTAPSTPDDAPARAPLADLPGRLPVAPPIVLSASPRTPVAGPAAPAQVLAQSAQPVQTEAAAARTPEAELLARLNVPATPATLAAARLIGNAATSMTSAYERLEALLGRLAPEQIPVALRSVLGFVGRMDLRNAAALPEQIAAFVSDVVDGPEAKIAQAVQAWLEITPEPAAAVPATSAPTPAMVATASAQAAERGVALEFDAKSAIMAMLAEQTTAPASAALAGALRDALASTTAVQLGVLSAQANDPSAITLALPAYFYDGGAPVQLQISRDAPNSKNKMDGDNFHIAFVLDTASLGTVAIDVQTVGRAVSVDVKTQGAGAAGRFRNSLGDLRGRLEKLRYRVSSIAAGVAAPLGAQAEAKSAAKAPASRRGLWDTQA